MPHRPLVAMALHPETSDMDPDEDVFSDPEETNPTNARQPCSVLDSRDSEDPEVDEDKEENNDEDHEDQIFSQWMSQYRASEHLKKKESGDTEEDSVNDTANRKGSLHPSFRARVDRRASLPCPATLSAMQLRRLHTATKAPVPVRANTSTRTASEEDGELAKPMHLSRRRSIITTIPELVELPERKTHFRRRNVMSLSDADRVCLICHDDLTKGASGIRELDCSHSFHNECIEEWLWRKQKCPTCRVQLPTPEVIYWSSFRGELP